MYSLFTDVPPGNSGSGGYSPHSTVNGTSTPSPPALGSPPVPSHEATHTATSSAASQSSRDTQRQVAKVSYPLHVSCIKLIIVSYDGIRNIL